MKSFIIIAFGACVLATGCSVYRSGQTPDDLYYSSSPQPRGGYAQADNSQSNDGYVEANSSRNDGQYYNNNAPSAYDEYATPDDRWLMMRVRDRARWSVFDDYSYYNPYNNFAYGYGGFGVPYMGGIGLGLSYGGFYSPFSVWGLGLGYSSFGYNPYFNSYWNWNSMYNPYYSSIVIVNPKTNPAGYNRLRNFNPSTYTNRNYNNTRSVQRPSYNGYVAPNSTISNGRRSSQRSDSRVNDSYRAPAQDRPVRVYTPSNNTPSYSPSNNSSRSSGTPSSGSGGSGSRPGRR